MRKHEREREKERMKKPREIVSWCGGEQKERERARLEDLVI